MARKPNFVLMLNVGNYLADTQHLTAAESGAYLHLLMACRAYGGFVPSADDNLARVCRMTAPEWANVKPAMLQFFHDVGGGRFVPRRDRNVVVVKGGA